MRAAIYARVSPTVTAKTQKNGLGAFVASEEDSGS
jgi:hypothetical protein